MRRREFNSLLRGATAAGQRGTRLAVFTLVMVALFVGLGVWQLQRRVETRALIAALNERLATAPVPLPDPSQWPALTSEKDEFRHVSFTATYESRLDAMVYSSDTSMRSDIPARRSRSTRDSCRTRSRTAMSRIAWWHSSSRTSPSR